MPFIMFANHRRYTRLVVAFLGLVWLLGFYSGCSRSHYRKKADKEAYGPRNLSAILCTDHNERPKGMVLRSSSKRNTVDSSKSLHLSRLLKKHNP